jgi:ribonuclease-3
VSVASRNGGGPDGVPPSTLLEGRLGVAVESAVLDRALTHRSFAYENGGLPTNERLEFLGDSVLGLVVTDALYRNHPDLPEGQLAKLRAAVVNMRALADVARSLELGRFVRLGRGEEGTGGRDKASILADTLEAVIGAVYIARGLDVATAVVRRLFDPLIERSARLGAGLDWKTSLQELTATLGLGVPEYVVEESGPTTPRASGPSPSSATGPSATARAAARRKPSRRPPHRRGRPSRRPPPTRRSRSPTSARARTPSSTTAPPCPNCPRWRPSAAV